MKKTILTLALLSGATWASAQSTFSIEGTTDNLIEGETVYLIKTEFGGMPTDSTTVKDGKFSFTGQVDRQTTGYLAGGGGGINFVIEPGTIRLALASGKIGGTPTNEKLGAYMQSIYPLNEKMYKLRTEARQYDVHKDSLKLVELQNEFNRTYDEVKSASKKYIFENLDNITPSMILPTISNALTDQEMEAIDSKACDILKANSNYQSVISARKAKHNAEVGKHFTDFSMQTPDGKTVSLSDYVGKGKYVLIDFWASWCGPCRKSMPALKELYAKYQGKAFEVVGVSYDTDKNAWTKAIKDLELLWPHMSDLKGGANSVASATYAINAIPYTLLVDPNGTIVAVNAGHEKLNEILSANLK